MKLSELLKDLKIYDIYDDADVTLITDDSRKVRPGAAFIWLGASDGIAALFFSSGLPQTPTVASSSVSPGAGTAATVFSVSSASAGS